MTRRPTWLSLASLGAAAALVVATGVPGMAQGTETPPAPTADITSYPNYGGEVDCAAHTFNGSPYAGNLKSIEATDTQTVAFTFCNPNVAFLSQVAFASLAIDDAQFLIDHAADGQLISAPNGTGPYTLVEWDLGNRIVYAANPSYWGTAALAPNAELRWSEESAQRLTELLSGAVDGIDNPGRDDMPIIEGDATLALYPREGLNTFYLGMNHTYKPWDDVKVRQAIALGIDRQRIVDNFYPPGSVVASQFTPCGIEFGCSGDPWYEFDVDAAKALLDEAGFPADPASGIRFQTKLQLRPPTRPYLPDPPTIAVEIQAQLLTNLGIDATVEIQRSGAFIDASNAGELDGIFLLGWGADYPDATNFLDYHFGSGAGVKFGDPYPDLVDALNRAGQTPVAAEREAAYAEANNLIKQYLPTAIIAHGGSGTAFKADVEGAHSSPLTSEIFAVMKPGDRDTLVFLQQGEPSGLYCADETDGEALRACEQVKESLYAYEVGGTDAEPSLATECAPNEDLTVWTCTLREGVTFHNGATLDASDVVVSYAAQWDYASPLHVGRTGSFDYWPALVGGDFLNAPAS